MKREIEISNREKEIANELQLLNIENDEIQRRKMWRCYGCFKRTQISKITIIQDHWYVPPRGCTGGDYWNTSNEVYVPCPKCNTINRICDTFVQIRNVSPIKTINGNKTYTLLRNLRQYANEVLHYYPKKGNGMITHEDIKQMRENI